MRRIVEAEREGVPDVHEGAGVIACDGCKKPCQLEELESFGEPDGEIYRLCRACLAGIEDIFYALGNP